MCCLKYEQDAYEYLISLTPTQGSLVRTREGTGTVVDVNMITGNLLVKISDSEAAPIKVHRDDVEIINRKHKSAKPKMSEND